MCINTINYIIIIIIIYAVETQPYTTSIIILYTYIHAYLQ